MSVMYPCCVFIYPRLGCHICSQLTGLSDALQRSAGSFGIDCHHADGVLGVRRQLRKQDCSLLSSNLGLVREQQMKNSLLI